MRTLFVIGIGAGDPDHLTLAAVAALSRLDVVFVLDKGAACAELVALREQMCAEHIQRPYRVVSATDPSRNRALDNAGTEYTGAVTDWYDARADVLSSLFTESWGPGETGGILVWGDPALYDSTLRVLERVLARGAVSFEISVIPGITSIQALAARHRVTLTGLGAPVHITTGRRLTCGMPAELDDVWVMLDGKEAFAELTDEDLDIYWGAYVGMPDELTVRGDLQERKAEILALRRAARARRGWIMDSYLLRRRRTS
ncbi:MAG: precorrin-6A synthase (deacetylating) [Sporichthyaceae bacterium]